MIDLEVNFDEFETIATALGATPELAKTTFVTVLRRTQKWLATQVRRDIAKATKVPVGQIKKRTRIRLATKNDLSGTIWIGLNPFTLKQLKARVGKRTGATWKGKRWPHAFEVDRRGKQIYQRRSRSRLPIEVVLLPVEEDALKVIQGRNYEKAQERLLGEFARLLKVRLDAAAKS